jgi:hypothetical protein
LPDEASLLRIAFVLERKERLDDIFTLLGRDRLRRLIAAAAGEDLWAETLDLLGHIGEDQRRLLAELAAELPDEQRAALLDSARELGRLDDLDVERGRLIVDES